MPEIYCGNNSLSTELQNKQLGTRYSCMQKGIGRGLTLPYDPSYAEPYQAIDQRKIYCGNKDVLPEGYDSFGSICQCLQKGVGIGKKQRAERENAGDEDGDVFHDANDDGDVFHDAMQYSPLVSAKTHTYVYVCVIICILFLLFLLLFKPSFVSYTKRDDEKKKKINWYKLTTVYIIFCITILCIYLVLTYDLRNNV